MTFEDMLDEQSVGLESLVVGFRVEANVTKIKGKDVVFEHGDFFVGTVPLSEFHEKPSVGSKVSVFIAELDDGFGNVLYDHKNGMKRDALEKIAGVIETKGIVEAEVVSVARAGLNLLVNGYVEAFMPKKQVSIEYMSDFDHLVGTKIEAKILSFDEEHENLILSHKELLRDSSDGALETLDYGVVYDCIVTGIARFGLFVDVGGLTGLIHISDLDWDLSKANVNNYSRGDKIKAMAKFVDEDRNGGKRYYLSVKHLDITPWENAKSTIAIRSIQDFEICKVETDTGNIMGSVAGICAMIPAKEVSWVASLMSDFNVGQIIPVAVEYMDNKLGFETIIVSHKNATENPWSEIMSNFKVGDIIDTVVTRIFSGEMLFVRILDGVDAIVHISDVDWISPTNAMEQLSVGDSVQVKLTQVNQVRKKLTASIKDVSINPMSSLVSGYKTKAIVKSIAKNGTVFVDVAVHGYHFDGIIDNKIIRKDQVTKDALIGVSIGDSIECVVMRLEATKIFLKCC
ncbi:S1 RNA-binding domain-containing protein [Photobacterium damselae]|uniref:S1 RNA-binding domain-containing protein n=1 Tax=Photobacterium damselae TaxID=38293 RepID=UPI0040682BB0